MLAAVCITNAYRRKVGNAAERLLSFSFVLTSLRFFRGAFAAMLLVGEVTPSHDINSFSPPFPRSF